MEFQSLESRYLNYCRKHKLQPNPAILCSLSKVKQQKSFQRRSHLVVVLDHLKDVDFLPLIDVIDSMSSSDIDAVDILNESPCILNEDQVLSLICAANQKLHTVTLQDLPFTKHFLRDLFRSGLACRVLKLSSSSVQKLDMVGRFMQLQKLNLDFCTSLSSLHKDCFSHMPNLMHLSMCGTRISNLWTTTAALSKLPFLIELRFQNCLCCEDTGPCPGYPRGRSGFCVTMTDYHHEYDSSENRGPQREIKNSFENRVGVCSGHLKSLSLLEISSDIHCDSKSDYFNVKNEVLHNDFCAQDDSSETLKDSTARKKYISHHASPICFEKHYREFMVASLPSLEVLDNLPIGRKDREVAKAIYSKHFEYLPYKRQVVQSAYQILHNREIASGCVPRISSKLKRSSVHGSNHSFSRSLCAAKLGASPWPHLDPISNIGYASDEEIKTFRPRQFEYHPSDSSHMAFGTLDGEVVVINHENGNLVYYLPPLGASNSILGLCWLKKYPSKVLAGSDNGLLRLFDISNTSPKDTDAPYGHDVFTFERFEQLTSVHVNATDEQFLVSGYTRNVALYDIGTGRLLQLFNNLHQEPINVAKFAYHSPFMFATSSFDHDVKMWDLRQRMVRPCYSATSSRGNVMVCFSPDDQYLLVSAIDNEVKQLLAVDGTLHTDFGIPSSGSSHNYTRSYYMNGTDYIITGSSDEHVVRICCAQTGRRLRDIYFEGRGSEKAMFVQSLRGDPFRPFNMSILASYAQSSSKCEIIKVNLLASCEDSEEDSYSQQLSPSFSLGG